MPSAAAECRLLLPVAPTQERDGIQGLHDSLFSSSTGELRALDLAPDFSDTLWAACMVNSRCFSDAAGRELLSLMVPLADMANHSNTPNAGYRLDSASQTFSIVSTQVGGGISAETDCWHSPRGWQHHVAANMCQCSLTGAI